MTSSRSYWLRQGSSVSDAIGEGSALLVLAACAVSARDVAANIDNLVGCFHTARGARAAVGGRCASRGSLDRTACTGIDPSRSSDSYSGNIWFLPAAALGSCQRPTWLLRYPPNIMPARPPVCASLVPPAPSATLISSKSSRSPDDDTR